MYRKDKSVKLQLKHLNDIYPVFEYYAKCQHIADENRSQFINLMLRNYINSNEIITPEQIQEIKERNANRTMQRNHSIEIVRY